MKIVYAGNGIRGKICLEHLLNQDKKISSILLHENKDLEMQDIADERKIPFFLGDPNSEGSIDYLKKVSPDLIILSGYNYILKKPFLSEFKGRIINLHGGKVPEYRGASVIPWAIINGEKEAGCSLLFVDEGIDTGNVLASSLYKISYNDKISDVVEKTLKIFPKLLDEAIEKVTQGSRGTPQESKGKCYPKRREIDNEILWADMSSRQVYDLVRSQTRPYWGAFSYKNGEKVKIWGSEEGEFKVYGKPGKVLEKTDGGAIVMAKDKSILIKNQTLKVGDALGKCF